MKLFDVYELDERHELCNVLEEAFSKYVSVNGILIKHSAKKCIIDLRFSPYGDQNVLHSKEITRKCLIELI